MIKKVKNECIVNGLLYGFGRFGLTKDDDGKIRGSIIVLTDVATQNTVEVHFIPQAKVYSTGKENNNYKVLEQIMNEEKTVEKVGEKDAARVRLTASLTTNAYYSRRDNSDELTLTEGLQVKGNFIHLDNKVIPTCGFNVECLYKGMEPELNRAGEPTGRQTIKVDIFDDYRQYFFPLTFKIEMPEGIDFLQTQCMEGESYLELSGQIINKTVEAVKESSAMAFGVSVQVSAPRTIREILITGAQMPKDLPMTEEEMTKARQNRQTFLAETKNRALEKESKKDSTNVGFGSVQKSEPVVKVTASANADKYNF